MKSILLVILSLIPSFSFAENFIRFSTGKTSGPLSSYTFQSSADFKVLEIGIGRKWENWYTGISYSKINGQDVEFNQYRLIGGYQHILPQGLAFIEASAGVGTFKEQGRGTKIEDFKGQVWGLDVGYSLDFKDRLTPLLDPVSAFVSYGIIQQTNGKGESYTSFSGSTLKLGLSYSF